MGKDGNGKGTIGAMVMITSKFDRESFDGRQIFHMELFFFPSLAL